jgi:phosphotransferase system enzyme I (PtsI)
MTDGRGLMESHWRGLGVSGGLVIGRVLRVHGSRNQIYRVTLEGDEVEREIKRFRTAVRKAKRQLNLIKLRAEKQLGRKHAYIFDAHLLMLEDRKILHEVEAYIKRENANAEWALKVVSDKLLAVYAEIKDEYLRERGSDIEDVVQRLIVALNGQKPAHRKIHENAVIVAEDLLPSVIAELNFSLTKAIATDVGGWTSHTAIIARGLGLPAVVGLQNLYRTARTGDEIIVDGNKGEVILHPSLNTIQNYQTKISSTNGAAAKEAIQGKAKTLDGTEITLRANLDLLYGSEGLNVATACGVGLYRSEFLLSQRGTVPTEEEQYQAYLKLAELTSNHPAKLRLFDIGGDKISVALAENERNPALGLRAIRLSLTHEEILRTQIRAVFRAAAKGIFEVIIPMIADVLDVRRAKKIIAEEKAKLLNAGIEIGEIKIGAMIEVPSAVLTADLIADEVDFFSLGTNDLVQYLLAVDRGNDQASDWFRTLHPAVLKSIRQTMDAACKAKIPTIVCGEMAGTPVYAVILIGLGTRELSMASSSLRRVHKALSNVRLDDAEDVARKCLECGTANEVEELVREEFTKRWSDFFPAESLPTPRN